MSKGALMDIGQIGGRVWRGKCASHPDDLGAFKEARRQYGNFQDISKAAAKLKGENAVQGTIPCLPVPLSSSQHR
ncbi:MAG: hypothetical protein WA624_18055 [Methylocella sp.]